MALIVVMMVEMMVRMMVMMIVMMMVMVSTWQKSQEGEDWDVTSPSGVIAPSVRHQPGYMSRPNNKHTDKDNLQN